MNIKDIIPVKLVRIVLLILFILIIAPTYGQIKEIKNVPSPEVANLGTFGSIPVGHYTGTPNISVPLYTMKVGKITVPIQAMYHTSNVKPLTPPSCLGVGWALSAGGYIARSVKGFQDELETYSSKVGYYFNHSKINEIDNSSDKSQKLKELIKSFVRDEYELSADEFSFNFNGYSGTFFMDKDGTWRVISDDNIKVEFNEKNGFKTIDDLKKRFSLQYYDVSGDKRFFDKFTLITPDGTRYEFGGDNATEYSIPYYNQVYGRLTATCWRLSKITTIDNRVINFEYKADSYMCDIHYAPQMIKFYENNKVVEPYYNFGRTAYSGFLMMPSRLIKISSDYETINFTYKRDTGYGNMFNQNTGCLFWNDIGNIYYNNSRYMYANFPEYLSSYRFSLFMGVHPSDSEYDTRNAIAKKITQDYLSDITVTKAKTKFLNIGFDLSIVRNRRLLESINFNYNKLLIEITDNITNTQKKLNNSLNISKASIENENITPNNREIIIGGDNDLDDFTFIKGKEYEYKFEYNLDSVQDNLWPNRIPLTYTDSWGYYSRYGYNPNNRGEWQLAKQFTESEFTERMPSLSETKKFTLKSIVYPTGGKTIFEYELNDYSKVFDINTNSVKNSYGAKVGGLRLKAYRNYDISGALLYSKEYTYKQSLNGESSGILKAKPCFYDRFYITEDKRAYMDFYSFDDINPYPLNFNTPNVGYSTVFEDTKDANNNLLSRIKYQYTNYDADINNETHMDHPADYIANVYGTYASATFTSMAFERGKLISKEVMDEKNKVLEKDTYKYTRTEGDPFTTMSLENHRTPFGTFIFSYLYKTYTNKYLVSVQKRQETKENGIYNTEKQFTYTKYGLLNSEIVKNDAAYKQTYYSYNTTWLDEKNLILPSGTMEYLGNCFYDKDLLYSVSSLGVPYISKQWSRWSLMHPNKPMRHCIDYTIDKADKYGNPVILDEHGVKTILIWSYEGMKLIANIQNVTYEEVKQALNKAPEDISELKEALDIKQLRVKLPKALITSYCYDDRLNLISKTDANGLVYKYDYDVLNRLKAEYRIAGDKTELIKSYKYKYSSSDKKEL